MKLTGRDLLLYAVTDRDCIGERDFFEAIECALRGGATILQLREKNSDEDSLVETARRAKKICEKYGVPLIVNDNYQAALRAGADGVHVGIEDAPVAEIRRIAGGDLIIGATAKTVAQAKLAQSQGADYLGVGAVFPSPTKTNAVRITNEQLQEIMSAVSIPSVAIGGISFENCTEITGTGAAGIAVVSAIFAQPDIEAATAALKEKCQKIFG